MALFSFKNNGGLMDVIRCDQEQYLVWKWTPNGIPNSTEKENAIRYGSRLRVKDGEVAVFMYKQKDGTIQDYILGPHDDTIKTANFPGLAGIVGAAFGGNTPFPAEIYFINLAGNNQIRFGIPYFDVFDPRFADLPIPCAVRGGITFNVTDYKNFIKLNRLVNFDLDDLNNQIKDAFARKAKSTIMNTLSETNTSVMQMEKNIDLISQSLLSQLGPDFANDFGINIKRIDISAIEMDQTSPNYKQLKSITVDQQARIIDAQTGININNLDEMMRIQRKDAELQVEGKNIIPHKLDLQAGVMGTAAEHMGEMGNINMSGGGFGFGGMMNGGFGFNPGGVMLGNTLAKQMGNMMNDMGEQTPPPPPPPAIQYHIAIDGQQSGPFTLAQLTQMLQNKQFTNTYYVWKPGMQGWELAGNVVELQAVFASVPPPPPPPGV